MSIQYAFPICAISDFGINKKISGQVSVLLPEYGISTIKTFTLDAQTWNDNEPVDFIIIEIEDGVLKDNIVEFVIQTTLTDVDDILLFSTPIATDSTNINYHLFPLAQTIPATNFQNKNTWYKLSLRLNQFANVKLKVIVEESIDDVVDFLADTVTYKKELTYTTREQNKVNLSPEDNIEYYLGKDTFKNLFFNKTLPTAWEIPARIKNTIFRPLVDTTVDASDGISYTYNNLGYRSNFDYTTEFLKDKKVILCLGDSDLFGSGIPYNQVWSELLQNNLPNTVVVNMGIRGISADTISRLGVKTIDTLSNSIAAVCVHWPHTSLREFVSKRYKSNVHTHRNYDLPYDNWWDHIDWQSNNYNFYKNKILLESICAKHSVDFFDLILNKDDAKVPLDFVQFGIYTSIGPLTHNAIANYFTKKINNQPSLFQTLQS